ncbi:MAG TPA: SUMF1/EgtB/PvdO family nonheme iron enzyme [Bryobacteraceae bacterium]|nr:SUMF1/EgtB/PvdO family nonheme iron enzyme [Bryobacteraceae bacterium]
MKEIGADGINGDTQDGVPLAFSLAADRTGHRLVFQPEGGPSDEALAWNAAAVPPAQTGRAMSGPADVDAHPAGASPFGIMDLIGNVWQITDEYQDDRTRAAILRGGSDYHPQGSIWYFPQAYRNDQHGKLLLMAPSYDRSATVGFRCVKDASGHSEAAM